MISTKEFIEASKFFVCVRLETYESKQTQDRIRTLLNGTMQNTAFVIYAPDGETKLTRTSRSPQQSLGAGRGANDNSKLIKSMEEIAGRYKVKTSLDQAVLQDFDSFTQSLNVAAADQRLLVFTVTPNSEKSAIQKTLQKVANDPKVSGRFHFDTAGKSDLKWADALTNEKQKAGVFIIQSGEFGLDGTVLKELPLNVSEADLKRSLLAANQQFSQQEKRKDYGDHVQQGKREGINFENNIAAGEDRDGDGKIDEKPGRGRGERPPRGRGPRPF